LAILSQEQNETIRRFVILETAGKEGGIKEPSIKFPSEITFRGGKVETVPEMDKKSFSRVADRKHSRFLRERDF